MIDRENKVAVITGSANGLGKALAIEFYRQNYHLALIDIDPQGLEKLKSNLQNGSQKITIHQVDVSNEQEVIKARQGIIDEHQRIDILVNNAGISISQTFDQVNLVDFKNLIDINFFGTLYCSKYFLEDLKQQQNSRLVNIISTFAFMGFPGKTAYASSKSAVTGFTNSLKTELDGTTVKVCLVIPPPLDTGLVMNGKHINGIKKQNEANFLKRNSMPLDIAAKRIVSKTRKGKYRILIGTRMFWMDLVSRLFPTVIHKIISNRKKQLDYL